MTDDDQAQGASDDQTRSPGEDAPTSKKKTAVVAIHGMGEQRPMETLRGLVEALWVCDSSITGPRDRKVYSKPDTIAGSFELRRITTRNVKLECGASKRADFFEFYWAHLMTGNTIKGVASWLCALLIRSPATVPSRLIFPWAAGIFLFIVTICFLSLAALKTVSVDVLATFGLPEISKTWYIAASIFSFVFGLFSTWWLAPVAGDAARYLSPLPDNVAARQRIREAGVDLLRKLHESKKYDRIIVIGHSLGSVIGYDVLNYAWGRINADDLHASHAADPNIMASLSRLENAAGKLLHADDGSFGEARSEYRAAQRDYCRRLAAAWDGTPLWTVSDFVTLGCPLSKADVLIARDDADFELRKQQRELPTNPPWLERNDRVRRRFRFSYPTEAALRTPHHAAVFAPVVWTNIYFESFLLALGDIISGAVSPLLGRGVLDVRLNIGAPVFRHLDYWKDPRKQPSKPWLRALRRAVNLKGLDDAALWSDQAQAPEIQASELPDP
ncbi:MAG: hypothetical protein U1E25_01405 [Methylocystis sp.]